MCGIAGIFDFNRAPVDRQRLETMTSVIAHRGPDGAGVFLGQGIGLGHRRLSIIDLEGGAQPLAATMAGAAILCVEVDPSRIERRLETRYLDEAAESLDDALSRVREAAAQRRAHRRGYRQGRAGGLCFAARARRPAPLIHPSRRRRQCSDVESSWGR